MTKITLLFLFTSGNFNLELKALHDANNINIDYITTAYNHKSKLNQTNDMSIKQTTGHLENK